MRKSWGGRRIRKLFLPRVEILFGGELDICEKVFSGAGDPRFGGEAAVSELML